MIRLAARFARTSRALAAAALVCVSLTPYSAPAAPTLPRGETRPAVGSNTVVTRIGSDRASLETTTQSIPAGRPFTFVARVSLSEPAEQVLVRFRASHPSGRLIFQRTRIFSDADAGVVESAFVRQTDDLDLRPGVFPVEIEVAITREGRTTQAVLQSGLLVYDGKDGRLPVALVARVNGQPLSDPSGRFIADPGRYSRARDDVHALSAWILAEPTARATLAVPPVLIEDWRRVAEGYEFAGPEGVEQVGAETPVPQSYAATLRILSSAIDTGRLELASLGYADPDLSDLADAGLLSDVLPQYERGLSSLFASLETTMSTGTVPAGGCVPPRAARLLADAGVRYAVVAPECTRADDATASPSSYRTSGGLVALVPDVSISEAVASGDASGTVFGAFGRHLSEDAEGPLVLAVELGAGGADVEAVTRSVSRLSAHPWAHLSLARDVAARPDRVTRLGSGDGNESDPPGYWRDVKEARLWSAALLAALGEGDADATTATRDSLIAQCSAWAGADGRWALADRGRTFADTARRLAADTLDGVTLAVEPITLAGASGDVPVTIRNQSDRTLSVRLELAADGGMRLKGPSTVELQLEPRETFAEVPVDLSNALTGRLSVRVLAGDVELDTASVTLRASYLDRIVTIAGVIVLLGILLAFIIRRVRSAERGADVAERGEAYTVNTAARRIGG